MHAFFAVAKLLVNQMKSNVTSVFTLYQFTIYTPAMPCDTSSGIIYAYASLEYVI